MKKIPLRRHPVIGCCGLDCGLCPNYYTDGPSRCPGCCGPGFQEKHPSCGTITCCVQKHELDVCGFCETFPCSKFDPKIVDGGEYDSFISYKNLYGNMLFIRENGMGKFVERQSTRIKFLEKALKEYNDGRSKRTYCLAAALLPVDDLKATLDEAEKELEENNLDLVDIKQKAKLFKKILNLHANQRGIVLKLRKKNR
ncbi:MAG: DUF3795 domain-containing protein [Candidatus Hodarchaeota archaeon]